MLVIIKSDRNYNILRIKTCERLQSQSESGLMRFVQEKHLVRGYIIQAFEVITRLRVRYAKLSILVMRLGSTQFLTAKTILQYLGLQA